MTLLAADDRSYLTSLHPVRYAFGSPESPLVVLNAADAHGCMWAADVPEGWDAPDVDTPMDRRQDGHGGYVGESTFEARTLSFEGTVTAPSAAALGAAYRRLLGAILGQLTGFVRYTHLDEQPSPMGLWLRPAGKLRWRALDERVADFAFVMVAEDPIKTGAAVAVGPVRLQGTAAEGGYPMGADGAVMPWAATGSVASSVVGQVPNDGDEDAHAVYRIEGPVPEPVIQLSTGEYVHLRLTLTALDTAVVDTADGTVTVNGVNRYDAWGPGSTFPLIPGRRLNPDGTETPGGAEVRLRSFTTGADPAAGLTVTVASSWR